MVLEALNPVVNAMSASSVFNLAGPSLVQMEGGLLPLQDGESASAATKLVSDAVDLISNDRGYFRTWSVVTDAPDGQVKVEADVPSSSRIFGKLAGARKEESVIARSRGITFKMGWKGTKRPGDIPIAKSISAVTWANDVWRGLVERELMQSTSIGLHRDGSVARGLAVLEAQLDVALYLALQQRGVVPVPLEQESDDKADVRNAVLPLANALASEAGPEKKWVLVDGRKRIELELRDGQLVVPETASVGGLKGRGFFGGAHLFSVETDDRGVRFVIETGSDNDGVVPPNFVWRTEIWHKVPLISGKFGPFSKRIGEIARVAAQSVFADRPVRIVNVG